jgi:DNA-binding XRE family transcriptional regulator
MPESSSSQAAPSPNLDSDTGRQTPNTPRKPRARFAPEYEVLMQRLIAARKAAGITQEAMAQALGKTQSHVSMCENREREISVIDLWKWCLTVGVDWSDFIRELEKEVVPLIDVGET